MSQNFVVGPVLNVLAPVFGVHPGKQAMQQDEVRIGVAIRVLDMEEKTDDCTLL